MEGRLFGVGNLCENFILGRADDALSSYVYVSLDYTGAALGYCVGGSETEWARVSDPSPPLPPIHPAAADTWELQCGTDLDPNGYIVYRNGAPVIRYTDTGGQASVGAGNRGWGMGMHARTRGNGQSTPGSVAVWVG